jgi:hypothetical protein
MAKTKQRKKAYNPQRSAIRVVPALMRSQHIVCVRLQSKVPDDQKLPNTRVYNHKLVKPYPSNSTIQNGLTGTPMTWSIWVGYLCQDHAGNFYHKGEWIVAKDKYFFDELHAVLGDAIDEVYESCNKSQVIDGGWIAVPYQLELSGETIMRILLHYGGYE